MEGWIKLYSKMLNWEWYGDTNVVRVFLHCLLKANYCQKNKCGIQLERGQFITSLAEMTKELHLSQQQTRTAISKLISTHEITIKATNKYTVVTVCNYESYQSTEESKQQTKQQAEQQTNNKQITSRATNKARERKEEARKEIEYITDNIERQTLESNTDVLPKKNKASSNSCFIKPTIEQIQEYCRDRGNNVDPERFLAYYESNGWRVGRNPMKDWKAAVRTWERQERYNGMTPTRCEDQDRALFEAEIEAHRKQVIAERQAQKEQEILEKKNREDKKLLDIIFSN